MTILEKTPTNKNLLVSYESELTKVSKRFSNPKIREIEISLSSEELKNEVNKEFENAHQVFEKELKIDKVKFEYKPPIVNSFNPKKIPQYLVSFLRPFYQFLPFSKNYEERLFKLVSIYLCTKLVETTNYNRMIQKENLRNQVQIRSLNYKLLIAHQTISANQYQYACEIVTPFIYEKLMAAEPKQNYISRRLRVMIFLLALTGIQIQQLRSLKVYQLESFLYSSYDHLSTEGHRVWEDRKKDLEYLLSAKDSTSYCFTAKSRPNRPLARESITRDINKVLKNVSQKHLEGSKLTSYSFRTGYINQLWKTPAGLALVKKLLTSTEPKTAKSIKEKY